MSDRTPPSRSFNTVKHSNRARRSKRLQKERSVLLSICIVVILILLSLAVFLFCSIANSIKDNPGKDPQTPGDNTQQNPPSQTNIIYTQITQSNASVHSGALIVVSELLNHEYTYPRITLKSFADSDIHVKQNGTNPYQCTVLKSDEKMEITAAYAADKMLTDFYLTFNDSSLIFIDAYRTAEEQAGKVTAVGFSEHETGLVFTMQTYDSTSKRTDLSKNLNYNWIYENCAKYGIICRYPDGKSAATGIDGYEHCFRYVGVPHATYITNNNLCLEEYVDLLKTNYAGDAHLSINAADGNTYEVYYIPAGAGELTTVSVPQNYEYTVSGDNIGGFIVTVNLSKPVA